MITIKKRARISTRIKYHTIERNIRMLITQSTFKQQAQIVKVLGARRADLGPQHAIQLAVDRVARVEHDGRVQIGRHGLDRVARLGRRALRRLVAADLDGRRVRNGARGRVNGERQRARHDALDRRRARALLGVLKAHAAIRRGSRAQHGNAPKPIKPSNTHQ